MRRRKTRTNAPPERPLVQRSLFEGEDVFVCPFCCEPLARVAGGGIQYHSEGVSLLRTAHRKNDKEEPMNISDIVQRAHENAVKHGFWDPAPEFGTAIALIHSELSEALEERRAGRPDLYFPCNAGGVCVDDIEDPGLTCGSRVTDPEHPGTCSAKSKKPEGVAVELADAVIRIADLCGHLGIDLEAVIALKMDYNETRPFKHGKRF